MNSILLVEPETRVLLEYGLSFCPPGELLIVPFACDRDEFIETNECSLRRGFFTPIFEDRKSFVK